MWGGGAEKCSNSTMVQQRQGQKLVDYSLHVRTEYWDRLNVLFPASRCSVMPDFQAC